MNRRVAAIAITVMCAVPLAGCMASQIPEVYEGSGPITVPESLKPTDVRGPMETTVQACATSWITYEAALDAYDDAIGKLPRADEALLEGFGGNAAEYADEFEKLSEITITRGEAIRSAAEGINHKVVEDLLIGIGEGEISDGEFMAKIATASDAEIDEAMAIYDETTALINQYAELCGVVVSGSTGA